jgi:hypothetical protein
MFLNPLGIFGSVLATVAAAASIPIIIHLLNRRKFERVQWAAMRFLRVSVEQNQRRIQIEDILLLILRCLLLALLVLALSRPVLRATSALSGDPATTAIIVLDNSYSMSQTDGVESRFVAGKKACEEIVRALPANSSVAVLLASDIVQPLIPEPSFDLTYATNALKDAALHDRPSNLFAGVRAALDTLEGRATNRKEIYVVTDGQSSAWRQMNDVRNLLDAKKGDVRAHFVFVGKPEERNLGITSLRLEGGLVPVNQPARVEVRVRNFGKVEARDVNVSIQVDADPPMDQTTIAAIPAGDEAGVSLFARVKAEGFHTVTAKIDADHLPADDVRSVALRAVKDIKVLLIDGDPGREPRDSEVFFLRHALRPVPRAEWDDYYVKLTTKTPTELDGVRFEDFDAVVSANVTDFSANALTQLVNYVKGGRGLIVFPGDKVDTTFYNEQLYRKHALLPAMLAETRGDAAAQDKWTGLADKSFEHDIAVVWRDASAGSLTGAKFFKHFRLAEDKEPPAPPAGVTVSKVRTVLRFADDQPAAVEKNYGQGRVVLFASTADTAWNDVPVRPGIWLPLINRTVAYAVARQDENLTIPVGAEFVHVAGIELNNTDARITKRARGWSDTAKDLNELTESRRIELVNGAPLLQFNQTHFAGPYEVTAGGAEIRFATQSDAAESSLESLTDDQFKTMEDFAHVVKWSPGTSLSETLEQNRVGTELWLPLAIAALLLATIETLLAHWFSKSK